MRSLLSTRIATILAGSVAGMGWGATAHAAGSSAAVGGDTAEVVVTASRREQDIVDVPAAVTAISGETLNERNLTQIEDFAAQVPGFSIQKVGQTGVRLVIRGQNTGGAGASVATIIDDVPLNTASPNTNGSTITPNFDTYDMERIEVLRGPQGTLYGATAQGGLLKYVTRKPNLKEFEGGIDLGRDKISGGGDGNSVKGVVNLPFASGKAALRVMGYHEDVAGFIDNVRTGQNDVNSGKRDGARAILLVQPSEEFSLRFTAFKQKHRFGSDGYADVFGSPLVSGAEDDKSYRLVSGKPVTSVTPIGGVVGSYEHYNAAIDYDFGGVTLTSSTSSVRGKSNYGLDISDGVAGPGFTLAAAFGPLFGQNIVVGLDQQNNHKKFTQEFRLASKGSESLFWQVGAFYAKEDINFNQFIRALDPANVSRELTILPFIPGIGGLPLGGSFLPGEYKELSGFGDVTFTISERFELSVGGRYTKNNQNSQVTNEPGLINAPVQIVNPEIRSSENKFTFSVAPRFRVSDDVSLYARIASGYRPGGPVLAIPNPPAGYPNDFTSDKTINYEVGVKGSAADGRVSFDVALYQIDWTDAQIISTFVSGNGQTFSVTGNGGSARSRGLEWSLAFRPLERLTLGWVGGLTDAQLTEDAPGLGGSSGDELPYVPRFSSALNVDYAMPLSETLTLNLGGSYVYTGKRYGNFSSTPLISNHPEIPSYNTLDLRAGLEFGRYHLDLVAQNVSNSRGLTDYRNNGGAGGQFGTANVLQPRSIALHFGANF